jgi:histidinol-phosphate/aromatic aminotransferase/cobyric acid decarboxylase-like protein
LKSLNALLNQYNSLGITPHMIEKVLAPEGITNHTRREMTSQLRQFSDFMNSLGILCSPVPKKYANFERSEFRPYIFSQDEIDRILYETDHLSNGIRCNNHKEVYPILIRIL